MMGSFMGRGNQYIQFVKALYCKLLTNGKQLPAFPLEARPGIDVRSQRCIAEFNVDCSSVTSIICPCLHPFQQLSN